MNTIQVIAAVTAFISILAAIIAGAWINQRGLGRQMEAFRNEMRAEFASIRAELTGMRGEMNARFSSLEGRVERFERQLDQIFKPALPKSGD